MPTPPEPSYYRLYSPAIVRRINLTILLILILAGVSVAPGHGQETPNGSIWRLRWRNENARTWN